MKKLKSIVLLWICPLAMASCSYSVTMAHTEGTASDVIDETMTNDPDLQANLTE